jgi:hypothetical protein
VAATHPSKTNQTQLTPTLHYTANWFDYQNVNSTMHAITSPGPGVDKRARQNKTHATYNLCRLHQRSPVKAWSKQHRARHAQMH